MNEPKFDLDSLRERAMKACANAHAPYSGFFVGAAIWYDGGGVYSACNVENASYGLTLCAERNAIASAVAVGMRAGELQVVVIYTPGETPVPPCGACRQVMQEFMRPNAMVYSCCDSEQVLEWSMEQLLPAPFVPEQHSMRP